uniref:Paraneoplastic antigen Ma-like C-terminal domain-containing protein n=1 Tax=Cyclopterus lumpus TaxID=8103 RepID=A0A8C2WI86_CYCLU
DLHELQQARQPRVPEHRLLTPGYYCGFHVTLEVFFCVRINTHKWHVPCEHEGFQTKLLAFLANEGKTVADITGLFSSTPAPNPALDLNTQLVNAISSLVEKCQATPADSLGYRKLRLFSGIKPTPLGEEEYDSWAEQTTHMLDEWQCSDVIKKQRVAESLKGPAADIVRGLRVTNPHATSNDYGQALETAFGTTDSAADLMVKFRTTFQRGGEKLSAYLLRLDKLLHAVHRRGGMEVADMNQVRIEQVARGALSNDLAALRIRLTYKLKPAPSFTELLRDIREEEEMILERQAYRLLSGYYKGFVEPQPHFSESWRRRLEI